MLIVVLTTPAKKASEPRHPPTDEWIKKGDVWRQWNSLQPQRKVKSLILQENGWAWKSLY